MSFVADISLTITLTLPTALAQHFMGEAIPVHFATCKAALNRSNAT